MDDMALLREYAARNSEAAFETLVSRRVNFVYSAALRQVRDPQMAGKSPRPSSSSSRKRPGASRARPIWPAGCSKPPGSSPSPKSATPSNAGNANGRLTCNLKSNPPRPTRSGNKCRRCSTRRWRTRRKRPPGAPPALLRQSKPRGSRPFPRHRRGHRPQTRYPRPGKTATLFFQTRRGFDRRHSRRRAFRQFRPRRALAAGRLHFRRRRHERHRRRSLNDNPHQRSLETYGLDTRKNRNRRRRQRPVCRRNHHHRYQCW